MLRLQSSVVWLTLAIVSAPCFAQQSQTSPTPVAPLRIGQSYAPAGLGGLVPEKWGTVRTTVTNPADDPADVVSVLYFVADPRLQFSRQLWIPPHSRRTATLPVLPPARTSSDQAGFEVKTLLSERSQSEEVLVKTSTGQMSGDALLPSLTDRSLTGLIADSDDELGVEAVVAMRLNRNLTRRVISLTEDRLPETAEGLEGLDHLVLSSDRPAADSASLAAIREWVHAGGRLWIMLDRVAPETVEALLGDEFACQNIDQVGLTKFTLMGGRPGGLGLRGFTQEFVDPIQFVRVLPSRGEILHRIDEWPASFFLKSVKGKVLFTTVGARAWIQPRPDSSARPTDELQQSRYIANDLLRELAFEFLGPPRETPALQPLEFQNFVSEQIGYRIISRGTVIGVLGLFCLGLVIAGGWLTQRQQLPLLGWLGPTGAISAALILVALGYQSRTAVPPTIAIAQLAEVMPEFNDLQLSGLLAFYNQDPSNAPLGAENGGVFIPARAGRKELTSRMVWTDLGKWHWENLTLSAGMQLAPFRYSTRIDEPISARATFGPHGLTGTIVPGPFQELSDLIVAMPGEQILAARLEPGNHFSAGSGDELVAGAFIGGSILSDEQRRRRTVYQQLLQNPDRRVIGQQESDTPRVAAPPRRKYPVQPMLLAWATPYDMQFTLPTNAQRVGSALLAVPLTFARPEPGAALVIPSPCVTYQSTGSAGAFDNSKNLWIGPLQQALLTPLRFQLPVEVLPIQIERAILSITLDAPSRTLEITGGNPAKPVILGTRSSPFGTQRFEIDQAEALQVDDNGGLRLGIRVSTVSGKVEDDVNSPVWKIKSLQLEVRGRALAP